MLIFGPPFGHLTFGFLGPFGCAKVVTVAARRSAVTRMIKCDRAILVYGRPLNCEFVYIYLVGLIPDYV
jgi:hypothetical protein